jgi:hypothetical protein
LNFDQPQLSSAGGDAANTGGIGQAASAGAKEGGADTGSGGHAASRDAGPGGPAAGAAGLSDSSAGEASAGGASAGGASAGGASAGDGNVPRPVDVQGRIVNFWSYPLVDVLVHIETQSAYTDANGEFAISGVTPPYDVWFTTHAGHDETWWFQGVNRVDPTFRVYRGGNEGSSDVLLNLTGRADDASLQTAVTIGSPYAHH